MARAPKEMPLEPHPLYKQLWKRPNRPYIKQLEDSIAKLGQLQPILVTMDNYIIDGVVRHQILGDACETKKLYLWATGRGHYVKGIHVPGESEMKAHWEEARQIMIELSRPPLKKHFGDNKGQKHSEYLVLEGLSDHGPIIAADLATKLNLPTTTIKSVLTRMKKRGDVVMSKQINNRIPCLYSLPTANETTPV